VAKYKAYGHRFGKVTDNTKPPRSNNDFGAAHSLHTEAVSYSKFIIALLEEEGLTKESYDEMFAAQVTVPKDDLERKLTGCEYWSLGFAKDSTSYGQVYFHFGDNGDFGAYFNFYPADKSGIVLFTNSLKIWTTDFIPELGEFIGKEIIGFFK